MLQFSKNIAINLCFGFLLAVVPAFSASLQLSSGSTVPGNSTVLTINLNSTTGQAASVQWAITYPSAQIASISAALDSASIAAGKTLTCVAGTGTYKCVLSGMNAAPIANGAVASILVSTTSALTTASLNVTGIAALPDGSMLAITPSTSAVVASVVSAPVLTSLVCSPGALTPPATTACTVILSAPALTGGLVASLSSNSAYVAVPGTITVPAGATQASFTASAKQTSANTAVLLTASANGLSKSSTITLSPSSSLLSSLQCPTTVNSAASAVCTIALTGPAPSGGATVAISDNAAALTVPASVVVPAGSTSVTFTGAAAAVAADSAATVTATYGGETKTVALTIKAPAAVLLSWVSCPVTIASNSTATCTVALNGAAPGALTIAISDTAASLTVPTSVTMPKGAVTVPFTVSAAAVTGDQAGTVTASLSGTSKTTAVTIKPAVVSSTFEISADPTELSGVSDGAIVKPTLGPTGYTGNLMMAGTGSVKFVPVLTGTGVQFGPGGSQAVNRAFYKFYGLTLRDTFNTAGGEIRFQLKSTRTFAERLALGTHFRRVFQVQDGTTSIFRFDVATEANRLVLKYQTGDIGSSHQIPAGQEDALYGKDRVMDVRLVWNGRTSSLYLNNTLVRTAMYTRLTPAWNSSSRFSFGASLWGADGFNDVIDGFRVTAGTPSTSTPVTTLDAVPDHRLMADASTSSDTIAAAENLASISCTPSTVEAGSTSVCELRLDSPASNVTDVQIQASSRNIHVPESVKLREGQTSAFFEISADAAAKREAVTLRAQLGQRSVTEAVVSGASKPGIVAPRKQLGRPGDSVRFSVTATEGATLAAVNLPDGATFDSATGEFEWTPSAAQVGTHTVVLKAADENSSAADAAVEVEVDSGATAIADVVNAASRLNAAACSSGSLASITGRWLSNDEPVEDRSGSETELSGMRVQVNGTYVPVVFASPTEVSFLCPEAAPGTRLGITLETKSGFVGTTETVSEDVAPGLFAINGTGRGQAFAIVEETGGIAAVRSAKVSGEPARAGDLISLRATGVTEASVVYIGGEQAAVEALRPVEGMIGMTDVLVRVPDAAHRGSNVPVSIETATAGGSTRSSNTVTIAIE